MVDASIIKQERRLKAPPHTASGASEMLMDLFTNTVGEEGDEEDERTEDKSADKSRLNRYAKHLGVSVRLSQGPIDEKTWVWTTFSP